VLCALRGECLYGAGLSARNRNEPDGVRWRSVALPAEHGGWGLIGEPVVVGLVVAPSTACAAIAIAAVALFLARHPLKLAATDVARGTETPRTRAACAVALFYVAIAAAAAVPFAFRGASGWWWPLAAATPLAAAQLAFDVRLQGRKLAPELLGGVALASVVAAELRASGWPMGLCLAAWGLVAAKSLGAILYVRARLRSDRGLPCQPAAVVAFHGFAVLAACVAAVLLGSPWLAALALFALLLRAAHGLSPWHAKVRPRVVGFMELAWGIAFAVALAVGFLKPI
jgi:YwiC-like protein